MENQNFYKPNEEQLNEINKPKSSEEQVYQNQTNEQPTNPETTSPKKPQKRGRVLFAVCIAIIIGTTAGMSFKVLDIMLSRIATMNSTVHIERDDIQGELLEEENTNTLLNKTTNTVVSDVSQVVENVMPSVVSITNMSVQQVQNFFGGTRERSVESSGSGIIIGENDTELLIVTNNHVIEGSDTLTVTFVDEESVEGVVKGTDVNKDLAIIAIPIASLESETRTAIKIAQIGDSGKLRVGEPAIAIGNALGYGQSVTTGVISALDRDIELQGFDNMLIQTDAAINPGNSGGALLNANGEVIGINTVKVSAAAVEGMGYAIPISDVSDIITGLMSRETRTLVEEAKRGYIGIQGVDVTADNARLYAMPQGVFVTETITDGAATNAGIQRGDIITGIQGINVQNLQGLQEQLGYYEVGEMIEIEIQRLGEEEEYERHIIEVILTENKG